MDVSCLNNHHVEQGRTGTKLTLIQASHTPTTNSETTDNPVDIIIILDGHHI